MNIQVFNRPKLSKADQAIEDEGYESFASDLLEYDPNRYAGDERKQLLFKQGYDIQAEIIRRRVFYHKGIKPHQTTDSWYHAQTAGWDAYCDGREMEADCNRYVAACFTPASQVEDIRQCFKKGFLASKHFNATIRPGAEQ